MADVEVHDDMDGDMGECEGLHQVKTAVELLHYIYIGVHQQCWNQYITCVCHLDFGGTGDNFGSEPMVFDGMTADGYMRRSLVPEPQKADFK